MRIPALGFALKVTSRGRSVYYWAKSVRDGGKVKHKLIAYMGRNRTLNEAAADFRQTLANLKRQLGPGPNLATKRKIQKLEDRIGMLLRARSALRVQKFRTRRKLTRERFLAYGGTHRPRRSQVRRTDDQFYTHVCPDLRGMADHSETLEKQKG